MKKLLVSLLCLFILMPTFVFAEEIKIDDTDLTIDLDENVWYVFTRDNIKDYDYLSRFNLTYEYMNNVFNENNAYLDAYTFWDEDDNSGLELFVIKVPNNVIINLNLYDEKEVMSIFDDLAKEKNIKDYNIYRNNNSVFGHLSYFDSNLYLEEYVTVINGDTYSIKFQSSVPFDSAKISFVENIMKSVSFDYKIREDEKVTISKKGESIWISALKGAVIGGLVGGVSSVIYTYVFKKKGKNNKNIKNN